MELAEKGRAEVSPNPMVGCVIVHEGKIIGEGYHKKYGQPHAEVNAINSVQNQKLLQNSILYVTLEPCSHYGKTPPCANLILDKKIPKAVICNGDPNPLVAGKGIALLRNAGVEVIENVLEEQGRELNKRFFTFQTLKRPYIILKWAQTADGFIARENFDSKWISGEMSRMLSHKWRSEEDSIFVGTNTVLHDNPSLTTRDWAGKSPIRIFIDKNLKINKSANMLDNSVKNLCYNQTENKIEHNTHFIKLDFSNEIIPQIMTDLYMRKIQSVIVEGGSTLLNSFIKSDLWDEARIFTAQNTYFEKGIEAPFLKLNPTNEQIIENDILRFYYNKNKVEIKF